MNDGGPAFPKAATILPNQHSGGEQHRLGFTVKGEGGMSLRDWFAGQALASIATTDPSNGWDSECARRAYQYADAMLSARALATGA